MGALHSLQLVVEGRAELAVILALRTWGHCHGPQRSIPTPAVQEPLVRQVEDVLQLLEGRPAFPKGHAPVPHRERVGRSSRV